MLGFYQLWSSCLKGMRFNNEPFPQPKVYPVFPRILLNDSFLCHPVHVTFTFAGRAGDGTQHNEYQQNTLLLNTFTSLTKSYEFPSGSSSDLQINFLAPACTPYSLIIFFSIKV